MHELTISVETARRVLLARQGLLAAAAAVPWQRELTGPAGVITAIRRLGALQLDPVSVVERNHQLTLYARVKGYKPAWFDGLYAKGAVFEYLANARCALAIDALPDFWPIMLQARENAAHARQELAHSVNEVLETARRQRHVNPREVGNEGPRLMGMGYNAPDQSSKASGRVIDLLWLGGDLVVGRRRGAEKWYSLPEHTVPADLWQQVQLETALHQLTADPHSPARPWSAPVFKRGAAPWTDMLMHRYLAAFGLSHTSDFRFGWQHLAAPQRREWLVAATERGEVLPIRIDGVKRLYWAPTAVADQLQAAEAAPDAWAPEPEVRFLPPLDNLLWDRPRLTDLWGFDYVWEVYIPPARRRYGAFTMPILEGDRLIGRIDPRMDRAAGKLILSLVQLEPGIQADRPRRTRIARALRAFARFHGATAIEVVRTEPVDLKFI